MDLICDERPSDSPFVERIWRSEPEGSSEFFTSMAEIHSEIVITKFQGSTVVTVRGPETKATRATSHAGAEVFGIQFRAGAFMPKLPPHTVMDRRDVNLPDASSRSFWLNGSAWQFPAFEDLDTFADRLVREDLLVLDPVVNEMLKGRPVAMSPRTAQRRFLLATGMTQSTLIQIERARRATTLLKMGTSILDTVSQAGYYDQPHLTRSLKRFMGITPAQVIDRERSERMSFLYKTPPF